MPTSNTRSPFAGVEDADVPGGGVWIDTGGHELELDEQRFKIGFKGQSYISEFNVLESTSTKHPKGSRVSWVVKINPGSVTPQNPKGDTTHAMGLGNIKGFLAKAFDSKEEDITEAIVNASVDGQNLLRGTVLKCIATTIPTRNGGQFTKCSWTYLRGGFVEQQRRVAAVTASLFPGKTYAELNATDQAKVNAALAAQP